MRIITQRLMLKKRNVLIYSIVHILILFAGVCRAQQYEAIDIVDNSFVYEDSISNCKKIISFYPQGKFAIREMNCHMLNEIAECNEGFWEICGDTLFLTTYFQNNIEDYLLKTGTLTNNDSIEIQFYSMKTGLPTNDYAIPVRGSDVWLVTDKNGKMSLPCELASWIVVFLQSDFDNEANDIVENINLDCGGKYRYMIPDALKSVLNREPFVVHEDYIEICKYNEVYQHR